MICSRSLKMASNDSGGYRRRGWKLRTHRARLHLRTDRQFRHARAIIRDPIDQLMTDSTKFFRVHGILFRYTSFGRGQGEGSQIVHAPAIAQIYDFASVVLCPAALFSSNSSTKHNDDSRFRYRCRSGLLNLLRVEQFHHAAFCPADDRPRQRKRRACQRIAGQDEFPRHLHQY